MIFKTDYGIIYCKDNSYQKEFDDNNEYFHRNNNRLYYNGYLVHREDGPAIKRGNMENNWYLNGRLHREDEPAKEYFNGSKYWYLNNEIYSEEEYLKIINLKNKTSVLNEI